MPSGGIRVDENTLGFAKEADDFLSLASAGLSNRDIPLFWRELSCDPERVQRYYTYSHTPPFRRYSRAIINYFCIRITVSHCKLAYYVLYCTVSWSV